MFGNKVYIQLRYRDICGKNKREKGDEKEMNPDSNEWFHDIDDYGQYDDVPDCDETNY